jgi:hypothetical protein
MAPIVPRSAHGRPDGQEVLPMIGLDLTEDERRGLQEVLEAAVSDLRMEIANTDSLDFRQMLKERKAVLRKTLAGLSVS